MARDDPQPGVRRLSRPLVIALRILAALLALLVIAYVVLYITKGRFLKHPFERIVSARAHRDVRVSGDFWLYLNPDIRFRAEGLSIGNPAGMPPGESFGARRIDTEASIWRLLFGAKRLHFLAIDGGRADLKRDAQGRDNWTFGGTGPITLPEIDRAAITDTRLAFADTLKHADIHVRFGDVAATGKRVDQPLTFTGGGAYGGHPFVLNGMLTTPNESIAGGRVGLKLHAEVIDTRIDAEGTLPGATRLDGADLRVTVAGRNLQAPGRAFGVILPATRPYRLTANLTKDGRDYRFTRMTGRIGGSDIAGQLRVTAPADAADKLRINGTLSSRTLDILDVGPLIGYSPERLDAQGGKGAITVVGGHPRVLPDAPLAVEQLKSLDAHIDYQAEHVRTGTVPIDGLKLGFYLEDRKLDLDPLDMTVSGGRWTSVIRINAQQRPVVTDYDIRLAAVPVGRLLSSFKVEESGTTAVMRARLQLHGLGDTLHQSLASSNGRLAFVFPQGTLWVRNVELAKLDLQNFLTAFLGKKLKRPTEIRCGLAAFTVTDGVAKADPILFDTTRATYYAWGQFSFKDESLDLSFKGKSKEFSLFSGQSPVGVGGWFAAPTINPISGELVARASAGVGLGLAAGPLAALAAFIDFGGEKDNSCGPVLTAQPAAAQHKQGKS